MMVTSESATGSRKGAAGGADLGSEQTGAQTQNCGPEEHGNASRCLQMIVMMSPVVGPAESKVRG